MLESASDQLGRLDLSSSPSPSPTVKATASSILATCLRIQSELSDFLTVAEEHSNKRRRSAVVPTDDDSPDDGSPDGDGLAQLRWSGAPSRRMPEMGQFFKALKGEIKVLERVCRLPCQSTWLMWEGC